MAESISSRVAWKLRKVISGGSGDAPSRTGTATVQRRDADGTVWVRFPGSSIDTPVTGAVVANVAAGDTISYDLSGGRVSVTGNASDPAAGERAVGAVRKMANAARELAGDAKAIAEATGQYFWHDDNGAHVSTEKDNPAGPQNTIWNSLGMLFRAGTTNLLAIVAGTDSGMDVYDGQGNDEDNIIASHRGSGSRIGRSGESHMELDYHSLRMIDKEGNEFFEVEDLRNRDGVYGVTETVTYQEPEEGSLVPAVIQQYDFPMRVTGFSVTLDDDTDDTANWNLHHTTSPAVHSYITRDNDSVYGDITFYGETNSPNAKTLTFGTRDGVLLFGEGSVAMGNLVGASGRWSHAEGSETKAIGEISHAEGRQTIAFGNQAHAEGWGSIANGNYAHAQNNNTIAAYESQTVIGKWNYNDSSNAFEIGNGLASANRSNAFEVGWDGTTTHYGDVPWTNFPLASSAAHYSSSKPLRYRKWGQMVNLMGAVSPKADLPAGMEYSLTIGTLPEGCRPQEELIQLCQGSGTASWMLRITTGGVVTAERYRTGSGYAVMPAPSGGSGGAWLTMNCTFIV